MGEKEYDDMSNADEYPSDKPIEYPQKPTTVAYMEFLKNITDTINNSGLPAFVMEPVVKDILAEIRSAANRQYEYDKEQYERKLAVALNNNN